MITGDDNFVYQTVGANTLSYDFDNQESVQDSVDFIPTK